MSIHDLTGNLLTKCDKMNQLKQIRIKEGLTKTKLAKAADVSVRTLSRAESDKPDETPRNVNLFGILKAINELSKKEYTFKDLYGMEYDDSSD